MLQSSQITQSLTQTNEGKKLISGFADSYILAVSPF